MKFLLTLPFLVLVQCNLKAQTNKDYFKREVFKINKLDNVSILLETLTPFKLIMMGEMHGTNEPAAFVGSLAALFASHGDSVQVGFEIPSDQMAEFLKLKTEKSIYTSAFFSKPGSDGRASTAWAQAIAALTKNPRIHIFFYDITSGESKFMDNRDSVMYQKIKHIIQAHPKWRTITLSGNVHTMLEPYKKEKKMAAYLHNDAELKLKRTLCTIDHHYESGTMLNNVGKGLELRHVSMGESSYSSRFDPDISFQLYKNGSGILFTRKVTAATLVNTHGAFAISGTITEAKKKTPVDTSVYVKLLAETGQTLKAYCNQEGRYAFTLPDSLNGRSIIIVPEQDDNKIKRDSIKGACSYNCTISEIYIASTERVKLKINTDSIKNYIVDFSVVTATVDFYTPVLYFKRNELKLVQSDYSLSTNSAICEITSILQCNKQFCIEIRGNCSPKEKDKDNLSLQRAILIRDRLIALGVNPKRLSVKGYADKYYQSMKKYYKTEGDSRPAYINKTDYEGQTVRFSVIRMDFKE